MKLPFQKRLKCGKDVVIHNDWDHLLTKSQTVRLEELAARHEVIFVALTKGGLLHIDCKTNMNVYPYLHKLIGRNGGLKSSRIGKEYDKECNEVIK